MSTNTDVITEKVYCTGQPQNDFGTMLAAMNGGCNNQWNNPWMYLIFFALFGGNGFGFGRNGEALASSEMMNKMNALSAQMGANQNSNMLMDAINGNHEALHAISATLGVSFAETQAAVAQVQNAITQVGGQVGMTGQQVINSVLLGNKDLTAAIQNCCCNTQQSILNMGYQNQLGQKDIINSIQGSSSDVRQAVVNGFANLGYTTAQQTCELKTNENANTQRIIDVLNCHWSQDLQQRYQDAKLELSQQQQNATLIAALKTTA